MTSPRFNSCRLVLTLWFSGALLASGCAWIPPGDPPAEYAEPPEMQ
jgi:hypothetical protein